MTKRYGIKSYVHEDEKEAMEEPYLNGCKMIGARVSVVPDEVFKDKAELVFGGMLFEVIFTPGHTKGGVCFLCLRLINCFAEIHFFRLLSEGQTYRRAASAH